MPGGRHPSAAARSSLAAAAECRHLAIPKLETKSLMQWQPIFSHLPRPLVQDYYDVPDKSAGRRCAAGIRYCPGPAHVGPTRSLPRRLAAPHHLERVRSNKAPTLAAFDCASRTIEPDTLIRGDFSHGVTDLLLSLPFRSASATGQHPDQSLPAL